MPKIIGQLSFRRIPKCAFSTKPWFPSRQIVSRSSKIIRILRACVRALKASLPPRLWMLECQGCRSNRGVSGEDAHSFCPPGKAAESIYLSESLFVGDTPKASVLYETDVLRQGAAICLIWGHLPVLPAHD